MTSLKEVKRRINTVTNTKKITEARRMISSAKLHQYQEMGAHASTYYEALTEVVRKTLASGETENPLVVKNKTGKTAVVIFASNSGMCGSFNLNMTKELKHLKELHAGEELVFYPVGKKIREVVVQQGENIGFDANSHWDFLASKTGYKEMESVVHTLIKQYISGDLRQVLLVSYHYKSMVSQTITYTNFLPFTLPYTRGKSESGKCNQYILEPSWEELLDGLIRSVLHSSFYAVVVDNQTAEYAARTMAMQLASENANNLLQELQLAYNKLRQQNITTELLDIVGSSFA